MTEPVELRTERLLLGPFRLEDVDDVLEYARDPEWAWSLPAVPQPYERRHAEEFVARTFLAPWDTRPLFAIVIDGRVVGGINLSI